MVWALDLGTTNSAVARWDEARQRPEIVLLRDVCRRPSADDYLEAPRMVPSATHAIEDPSLLTRVGNLGWLSRRVLWGRHAHIGRPALELNDGQHHRCFAPTFKPQLMHEALRPLLQTRTRVVSARGVAWMFLRELLSEVKRSQGERIRELVITTPVEAYESYRAELLQLARQLGIRRLRFVDEPVAAALGYGLTLRDSRVALVVDFGGGTLDLALVSLGARDMQAGSCRVLAKEGRAIGGNLIDRWLLDDILSRAGYRLRQDGPSDADADWYRVMLAEARRVKERLFFEQEVSFDRLLPEELRDFEARLRGAPGVASATRADLERVLTEQGLYRALQGCLDGLRAQAREEGLELSNVDDVLMVGGSTLLPGVYPFFEEAFGRDRVRAFQPFEAVAQGAAAYAADRFSHSDFVVHDYAIRTYDPQSHEPEYTVVVPRGTRFPTAPDLWKRQLVPTCSLGEPERIFKLVICELGRADEDEARRFQWDADGGLHRVNAARAEPLVVPLNEHDPTLGELDPPHRPSDRRARLEIGFGVNDNRWLVATVKDLLSGRLLMRERPVVRLL